MHVASAWLKFWTFMLPAVLTETSAWPKESEESTSHFQAEGPGHIHTAQGVELLVLRGFDEEHRSTKQDSLRPKCPKSHKSRPVFPAQAPQKSQVTALPLGPETQKLRLNPPAPKPKSPVFPTRPPNVTPQSPGPPPQKSQVTHCSCPSDIRRPNSGPPHWLPSSSRCGCSRLR